MSSFSKQSQGSLERMQRDFSAARPDKYSPRSGMGAKAQQDRVNKELKNPAFGARKGTDSFEPVGLD